MLLQPSRLASYVTTLAFDSLLTAKTSIPSGLLSNFPEDQGKQRIGAGAEIYKLLLPLIPNLVCNAFAECQVMYMHIDFPRR